MHVFYYKLIQVKAFALNWHILHHALHIDFYTGSLACYNTIEYPSTQ